MNTLDAKIESWYKNTPRRSFAISILHTVFQQETGIIVSYSYFFKITKKVTKVQSIKTGGFFAKFSDFIDMTLQRTIKNVRAYNTLCIDEKPFIPRKFDTQNLRVHKDFRGKGTAKMVDVINPLKMLKPKYLLCSISVNAEIFFTISNEPINSEVYDRFLYKLSNHINNDRKTTFFLQDNASFHKISKEITNDLNNKSIYITRTIPLGCFTNPIEEFFSQVNYYYEKLLSRAILLKIKT